MAVRFSTHFARRSCYVRYGLLGGSIATFGMMYPQFHHENHAKCEGEKEVLIIVGTAATAAGAAIGWFGREAYSLLTTTSNPLKEEAKEKYEIDKEVYGDFFNDWSFDNFNYGLIGTVSVGKSCIVNVLLNKQQHELGAAAIGIMETTIQPEPFRYDKVDAKGKNIINQNIVLWDLAGFGTCNFQYSSYVEKWGLPLYDGIMLITSGAFRFPEKDFYVECRNAWLEVAKSALNEAKLRDFDGHIPVYIIQTQFDTHLRNELNQTRSKRKHEYSKHVGLIGKFLRKHDEKFSHVEFMEIYEKAQTEIMDGAKKEFEGVFTDNQAENDKRVETYCFIVCGTWENRMLTNHVRVIDGKTEYKGNGWMKLQERLLKDPIEFSNATTFDKDENKKKINEKLKADWKSVERLEDSPLYQEYTKSDNLTQRLTAVIKQLIPETMNIINVNIGLKK
eukprot:498588_1